MFIMAMPVLNMPAGQPSGFGFVGFKPAASAARETTTEFEFPVSIPIFHFVPSLVRASMQGVPSQSSSGTSAANVTIGSLFAYCSHAALLTNGSKLASPNAKPDIRRFVMKQASFPELGAHRLVDGHRARMLPFHS